MRKQVVDHLFAAIVRGEFRPRERLVESRLARALGVAQSTLRESLMELEHKGLVARKSGHGTFVTKLSLQEIEDTYAVRIQLEPLAASLACQRMNEGDHAQLQGLVEEIRAAGEQGDPLGISQADARFHQYIWKLSGNKLLERLLGLVYQLLWAFELIRLYSAPTYDFRKAVREHVELLNVLRKGTPEEVKITFRAMLQLFCSQDMENLGALEGRESPNQDDGSRANSNRQREGLGTVMGEPLGDAGSIRKG